jgi:hypothetical protein
VKNKFLKASAALGAAGAGLAFTAGPASADTITTATPSTNLPSSKSVSVLADSGIGPYTGGTSNAATVSECTSVNATLDCMLIGTLPFDVAQSTARNELTWSGNVTVTKMINGHLCQPAGSGAQCLLIVKSGAATIGSTPITFK